MEPQPSRRKRIATTPEQREIIAENMKERVYSTITLLALLTALWAKASHHSHIGVIVTILGAVVALWLATLIAARMSYRAVHSKGMSRAAYTKVLYTSAGLLAPALLPIVIIAVSGITDWYTLETALMASMVIMLLQLFLLSFTAGLKIYDNPWRPLVISLLEMSVGVGVILLKLAAGE